MGGGEKPESQKARTGAGVKRRGAMEGREGPRVREHYTRQLIAAAGFFVSTLKGGWQWICSRKGFGLGNAHPLSTKACGSAIATSLFFKLHACALFATVQSNNCTDIFFP